jgi:hypothetical protein
VGTRREADMPYVFPLCPVWFVGFCV